MSAYDDWLTTDPSIENACEECGVDLRFDEHEQGCTEAGHEPDYEAIVERQNEIEDW